MADNYKKLCTIRANLSRIPILPHPKVTGGGIFYRVDYDLVLLFGLTELKAQIAWREKVSGLYLLFNPTDIGLILRRVVFRERRNGKFFKNEIAS